MPFISGCSTVGGTNSVVGFATQAADISTSGTTYAAGADVLTSAITFTADGTSTYAVIMLGPGQTNTANTNNNEASLTLDGAQSVFMMYVRPAISGASGGPVSGEAVISPAAGSHTVNVRFYVSGGTGTLYAGTSLATAVILVMVVKL